MTRLPRSIAIACIAALAAAVAPAAQAAATTMLGDTLHFERLFPDLSTPYLDPFAPDTTVVTGDATDAVWWTFRTMIDPGANELVFSLPSASVYIGNSGTFDGYRITGFSHDIASVSLVGYGGPLTITPTFGNGPRAIAVNLDGSYGDNHEFTLAVEFASAVPEPSTVALLLAALGLMPIVAGRRR